MERVADWLWRRYRQNFLVAASAFLLVFIAASVTTAAAVAGGVQFRQNGGTILRFVGASLLAQSIVAAGVLIGMRRPFRVVTQWGRNGSGDAVDVWNSALRLPTTITQRMAVVMFPVEHLLLVPQLKRMFNTTAETIGVHVAIIGIEFACLVIASLGCRLLFGPLTRELSPQVPLDCFPARRDLSLERRVMLPVYCASLVTALLTGIALSYVENTERWLAYTAGAAALAAVYPTFMLMIGVVAPSVRPLRDIEQATARVARGEFAERLPIVSADVFGDVAIGFNQMQ